MAGKVAKFRLTPQGHIKLLKVLQRTRVAIHKPFKEGCEKVVKPMIATRAPTLEQEGTHISAGEIVQSRRRELGSYIRESGTVGVADERRFIKGPGQYSLREAILREPIKQSWIRNVLTIPLGDPLLYNPGLNAPFSIGFSWKVHYGIRSTDDPVAGGLWKYLLEAWEYGGTAVVFPRTSKYLEPERGVFVEAMRKTIPPFGMFTEGAKDSREPLRRYIELMLKRIIRTQFSGV